MSEQENIDQDHVTDVEATDTEGQLMTETTTPTAETPEVEGAPETGSKAGREAAKYRTRLREVEAERDATQARLLAAQQHIVNSKLSEQEQAVSKLVGLDVATMFTEEGDLNEDALTQARQQWHEQHAALIPQPRAVPNTWDRPTAPPQPAFQQAFAPKQ